MSIELRNFAWVRGIYSVFSRSKKNRKKSFFSTYLGRIFFQPLYKCLKSRKNFHFLIGNIFVLCQNIYPCLNTRVILTVIYNTFTKTQKITNTCNKQGGWTNSSKLITGGYGIRTILGGKLLEN